MEYAKGFFWKKEPLLKPRKPYCRKLSFSGEETENALLFRRTGGFLLVQNTGCRGRVPCRGSKGRRPFLLPDAQLKHIKSSLFIENSSFISRRLPQSAMRLTAHPLWRMSSLEGARIPPEKQCRKLSFSDFLYLRGAGAARQCFSGDHKGALFQKASP